MKSLERVVLDLIKVSLLSILLNAPVVSDMGEACNSSCILSFLPFSFCWSLLVGFYVFFPRVGEVLLV